MGLNLVRCTPQTRQKKEKGSRWKIFGEEKVHHSRQNPGYAYGVMSHGKSAKKVLARHTITMVMKICKLSIDFASEC